MSEASSKGSSVRAIFQTLVLTAFADGRPELGEARVVAELIALDPRFATIVDAFELAVQVRVLLDQHGLEDALDQIVGPISSEEDRKLTFRLCSRVMIADGKTEGGEALVLGTLQERFGLSNEEVVATLAEERKRKAAP